jgi:hypothetical protein
MLCFLDPAFEEAKQEEEITPTSLSAAALPTVQTCTCTCTWVI